jgi:hypothetical protein
MKPVRGQAGWYHDAARREARRANTGLLLRCGKWKKPNITKLMHAGFRPVTNSWD